MIFEDDDGVVLEKEAGILNASLCVRTGQNNIKLWLSFLFVTVITTNCIIIDLFL